MRLWLVAVSVYAAVTLAASLAEAGEPETEERADDLALAEVEVQAWIDGAGAMLAVPLLRDGFEAAEPFFKIAIHGGDMHARAVWGWMLAGRGDVEAAHEHLSASAASGNPLGRAGLAALDCRNSKYRFVREEAAEDLLVLARSGLAFAALERATCADLKDNATGRAINPVWFTLAAAIAGKSNWVFGEQFWHAFGSGLRSREALAGMDAEAFDIHGAVARREFDDLASLAYRGSPPSHVLWAGAYICAQGLTGAQLMVEAVASGADGEYAGMLHIFPTPMNPRVPEGCIRGTVREAADSSGGKRLHWKPEAWIVEPPGFSLTQGAYSVMEFGDLVARGTIEHPHCSEVVLQRVILSPADFPPACRLP